MSASPFTSSHSPNAFSSCLLYNYKHIPIPFAISVPPKVKFIIFSSFPANSGETVKIDDAGTEDESGKFSIKHAKPNSCSGSVIKAPTAPWMKEPLLVKPNEIFEFRKQKPNKDSAFRLSREHHDMDFTGKVGGGRGRVAMEKIFKGIDKLLENRKSDETEENPENFNFKFAPGELWGDDDHQNPAEVDEISGMVVDESSDLFDVYLREVEIGQKRTKKLPWARDEKMVIRRVNKEKIPTSAEVSLDAVLLERLRGDAAKIKKWVKVKKLGITQIVVDQIRLVWRDSELALLRFDLPLSQNMYRAREIVEMKTGGLVVWTHKDFLAVYRGTNYHSGPKRIWKRDQNSFVDNEKSSSSLLSYSHISNELSNHNSMIHEESSSKCNNHQPSLYEREADRLLDGLGPRFVDWWMSKPLPVDADLLPEVVPGFKTPFRLCPPHTRSKLTDSELTYLRKLAHPLPTHFVLGRNRKLQGLAAAIIKLWERCHIAKIALKWGIPNTDNEQMAYELKILTGGVLLLRNKFFIILYRGKDFLAPGIANLVNEREMELTRWQAQEEAARLKASETIPITDKDIPDSGILGTLSEFHNIQSESEKLKKAKNEVEVKLEVERERLKKELKDQEHRLFILKKKIEKSAIILEELKVASRFTDKDLDKEIISDEERISLRNVGLKTDSSLVLGRRGVYNGVIEGIHQHWKHKEVVRVVTMQRKFLQVIYTSELFEAQSGGILISVVKLKEGHAIILYRGKNYRRPKFTENNLLTKREALSRSLELQRIGSLKFFARQREQMINELKQKLAKLSE